jgi:DNA-binding response OmpR family regulator
MILLASPSGRQLIVVVDDAHSVRLVASRALTEAGYDVLTAPDGASAMALIQGLRTPPDLVITDLRMPLLDGQGLAAWLGARYPQVPLIFISAWPEDVDRVLPGPLIEKPFTPAGLCNVVCRVLERRQKGAPVASVTTPTAPPPVA